MDLTYLLDGHQLDRATAIIAAANIDKTFDVEAMKIERIYCWIATDKDGDEGICGGMFDDMWLMLAGADRPRIESFRGFAEEIARQTGSPVKLKVFGTGTVIDQVEP
jgi:hypothetical protein